MNREVDVHFPSCSEVNGANNSASFDLEVEVTPFQFLGLFLNNGVTPAPYSSGKYQGGTSFDWVAMFRDAAAETNDIEIISISPITDTYYPTSASYYISSSPPQIGFYILTDPGVLNNSIGIYMDEGPLPQGDYTFNLEVELLIGATTHNTIATFTINVTKP